MKLSEKLLNKLAEDAPQGRHLVSVSDEGAKGWTATLTVDRADSVGCVIWELALQSRAAKTWDVKALTTRAEGIADSVTGLLEPLKLIEVDALRLEALLRSDAPLTRGDDLFYYEAKLQPRNTIMVRRYRGSHAAGDKRDQVPFTLTHDAIGKLVDDMVA
jgi:hypothetical protein